jgi:mono/diheme cytochrome c family protein
LPKKTDLDQSANGLVRKICLYEMGVPTSAPFNRDLELAVIDCDGPHGLASMRLALLSASNMTIRLAILALLLGTSTAFAEQVALSPMEQKGRALAERMCAQCHAIGRRGKSPHAAAPPFRDLGRRIDLDSFVDRLRDRLMVDHPDMPTFHFRGEDARALRLYLRCIQAP